ncbi:MAG: hypothetical protein K6F69_10030 [Treponema sp.]|nr:hypothetical protein [Treponema sp.]
MNSSKIIMAIGTGIVSVFGLAFLFVNQDKLCKKRYCKSHEKNNAETKKDAGSVTEDIIEVPVRVRIPQERVIFSETKQEAVSFYVVKCIFGHVGRNKATVKELPIKARNAKEAAEIARYTPRVKHDFKYAILNVRKVSFEEFKEVQRRNNLDPYFRCTNRQQQREFEEHMEIFDFGEEKKLYNKKHSLRKTYNFREPGVEKLHGDISSLDIA